jgi:hypothetical protein
MTSTPQTHDTRVAVIPSRDGILKPEVFCRHPLRGFLLESPERFRPLATPGATRSAVLGSIAVARPLLKGVATEARLVFRPARRSVGSTRKGHL